MQASVDLLNEASSDAQHICDEANNSVFSPMLRKGNAAMCAAQRCPLAPHNSNNNNSSRRGSTRDDAATVCTSQVQPR